MGIFKLITSSSLDCYREAVQLLALGDARISRDRKNNNIVIQFSYNVEKRKLISADQ